jgi:hypothetical protein
MRLLCFSGLCLTAGGGKPGDPRLRPFLGIDLRLEEGQLRERDVTVSEVGLFLSGSFCGIQILTLSAAEGEVLQLPLRQLTEGVGNGAPGVERDRGVADRFPAEPVADLVDGAVGEQPCYPSLGTRAPPLVGEAER